VCHVLAICCLQEKELQHQETAGGGASKLYGTVTGFQHLVHCLLGCLLDFIGRGTIACSEEETKGTAHCLIRQALAGGARRNMMLENQTFNKKQEVEQTSVVSFLLDATERRYYE
jgi:hypothetical protein